MRSKAPLRARATRATRAGRAHGGRDRCSGCESERRSELDAALLAGISQRLLAERFGLSRSAIQRHRKHVSPSLVLVAAPSDGGDSNGRLQPEAGSEMVAEAQAIYRGCKLAFDQAIAGGNLLSLSLAARSAMASLELLCRVLERLEARQVVGVVDVQRSAEWIEMRALVVEFVPQERRAEFVRRLRLLAERRTTRGG
ncbi:MAG: hypothetical protein ACHQ0J_05135 [Candidatus Dormibacterales bacterium]